MAQVAHAKSSSFIALLDPQGQVLDVNPAALIAGGVDRAEVIGLPLWTTAWWSSAPEETADVTEQAIVGAARGQFSRFDVDVRIESAGRTSGTLDLLLRPLRGRDGQVAFIVAEGRAITDRKRVEQRLARQNAELSALTQRLARVHDYRERLLGELSHDLRAPLQVVITRSEQLLRTADSERPDATREHPPRRARRARADQRHARAGQGRSRRGHASRSWMRISRSRSAPSPSSSSRWPRIATSSSRSTRPPRVNARFDVERVSRIVSNLLANAIRHTPVGGSVRCALDAGDGAAALSVADSGPGVPEEHRDKVFGRFRSGLDGDGRSDRRRGRTRSRDRARVRRASRRRDLALRRSRGRRAVHRDAAAAPAGGRADPGDAGAAGRRGPADRVRALASRGRAGRDARRRRACRPS